MPPPSGGCTECMLFLSMQDCTAAHRGHSCKAPVILPYACAGPCRLSMSIESEPYAKPAAHMCALHDANHPTWEFYTTHRQLLLHSSHSVIPAGSLLPQIGPVAYLQALGVYKYNTGLHSSAGNQHLCARGNTLPLGPMYGPELQSFAGCLAICQQEAQQPACR